MTENLFLRNIEKFNLIPKKNKINFCTMKKINRDNLILILTILKKRLSCLTIRKETI